LTQGSSFRKFVCTAIILFFSIFPVVRLSGYSGFPVVLAFRSFWLPILVTENKNKKTKKGKAHQTIPTAFSVKEIAYFFCLTERKYLERKVRVQSKKES
jgi:hypothetical protein